MTQDLLDIYSDYLIAQSQYATATGLSNLLEGSISHDRFTRFLNRNAFNARPLPPAFNETKNSGIFSFSLNCLKLFKKLLE